MTGTNWLLKNIWVGLIAVVIALIGVGAFLGAKANRWQKTAEFEFKMVRPPVRALPQRPQFSDRGVLEGFVTNSYSGTFTYEELRKYYDVELARNQWKFSGEEHASYGWPGSRELTGKIAYYLKNGYRVELRYPGPREAADEDYTYSFTVQWSLPEAILGRIFQLGARN